MKKQVSLFVLLALIFAKAADCSVLSSASYREREQAAYYCGFGMSIFLLAVTDNPAVRDKIARNIVKTTNTLGFSLYPSPMNIVKGQLIDTIAHYVAIGDKEVKRTGSYLSEEAYLIGIQSGSAVLALQACGSNSISAANRSNLQSQYGIFVTNAQKNCRNIGLPENLVENVRSNAVGLYSPSDLLSWHLKIVSAIASPVPAPVKKISRASPSPILKVSIELCQGVHLSPVGPTMPTYEGDLVLLNISRRNLTLDKIQTVFCNSKSRGIKLETTKPARAGKKAGFFIAPGRSERVRIDSDGYTNQLLQSKEKGSLYLDVIITGHDSAKRAVSATFSCTLPALNKLPSIGEKRRYKIQMIPTTSP